MITLGIETSCDETAVAIVRGQGEVLSSRIASQEDIHSIHGGIVPELACRRHVELIGPMVRAAMERAEVKLGDIGLVAATRGPGLVGALLVGLTYAKALAWAARLPLAGVNHLEGHMASALVHNPKTPLPCLILLVSGGHTELFLLKSPFTPLRLGGTRDDAAGEAFDKVARLLGLGYPGGPLIDAAAKNGKVTFDVPVGLERDGGLDFSFSGPKTAVKTIVRKLEEAGGLEGRVADVCASFQDAVARALFIKTKLAAERNRPASIAVVGGVAANSAVRATITRLGNQMGLPVTIPAPELCTDNAVMIAAAGARRFLIDGDNPAYRDFLEMDALPSWTPGSARR
jgi:N6-L-threonylcarbamoyladenine synthase